MRLVSPPAEHSSPASILSKPRAHRIAPLIAASLVAASLLAAAQAPLRAGEIPPRVVERVLGRGNPAVGLYSDRTLVLGLRIDRTTVRLVAYTVKDRPYRQRLEISSPRAQRQGWSVQVEITLLGPDSSRLTRRVDVNGLCLAHGPQSPPHIEGDTALEHRTALLVEVPELPGFNRVEVAFHDPRQGGGLLRWVLGRVELDRERFTRAGGGLGYDDLVLAGLSQAGAFADAEDLTAAAPPAPEVAEVLWPEDLGDPDIYAIHGDPNEGGERMNVVIVPDGYTYQEKALMEQDAEALVAAFRSKGPFSALDRFINYSLVYAYSVQSGIDQCDCGTIKNNAMGTYYPDTDSCGSNVNRCIRYEAYFACDVDGTDNIVAAELRAPYHDTTIIMSNDFRYGGCGLAGRATYAARNGYATDIAVHEFGHSFSSLSDEYVDRSGCGNPGNAPQINFSTDPNIGAWPEWIDDLGLPRQGARYYTECLYRPQAECWMKSILTSSTPFCRVCRQHIALQIYGNPRVSPSAPVASMDPPGALLTGTDQSVSFSVETRLPSLGSHDITWEIEEPGFPQPVVVATGTPEYTHTFLLEGTYALSARVVASTNLIKPVKTAENADTATWDIQVNKAAGRLPDGAGLPGTPLAATLSKSGRLNLTWGAACSPDDTDYEVYEGALGSFTSHTPLFCTTHGATSRTFTPSAGDTYYLVVPRGPDFEGSYGLDSLGRERPPAQGACLPQAVSAQVGPNCQ